MNKRNPFILNCKMLYARQRCTVECQVKYAQVIQLNQYKNVSKDKEKLKKNLGAKKCPTSDEVG